MPYPQFTLRSLLVAMLVVAAFFGGAAWQSQRAGAPAIHRSLVFGDDGTGSGVVETLVTPDGTKWFRIDYDGELTREMVFKGERGERITVRAPATPAED